MTRTLRSSSPASPPPLRCRPRAVRACMSRSINMSSAGIPSVRRRTTSSVIRRSAPSRASIDGVRVEAAPSAKKWKNIDT